MNKITLTELYNLAYNGQKPFNPKEKHPCNLFFANIVTYLADSISTNSDELGIIDVYLYYMHKLGYDLNDVYYCINKATEQSCKFDGILFTDFSGDDIFDEHRDVILSFDDDTIKSLGIQKEKCSGDNFPFTHNLMFIYAPRDIYCSIAKPTFNTQNKNRLDSDLFKKFTSVMSIFFDSEEKGINFGYDKTICQGAKKTFEYLSVDINRIKELRKQMLESCTVPLCKEIKSKRLIQNYNNQELLAIMSIKDNLIGQTPAVEKVQKRLISASYGFNIDGKPIASFLLTGPTGVGKTETAKAVAKNCFDNKIFVVDMSTYKHGADVSRLLGGSPNYVGYGDKNAFCDFIQENPKSVILFDEIEKAHPEVLDLLMRILDEGQFINAKNQVVSLENCVIFCTTNFTQNNKMICGFNGKTSTDERMTSQNGLKKELVGRFSEVIEYLPLTKDECKQIARIKFLNNLITAFESKNKFGLKLEVTDEALDQVVFEANTRLFGARDLRKSIQEYIIDPVCEYISNNNPQNTTLIVKANLNVIAQNQKQVMTDSENKTESIR